MNLQCLLGCVPESPEEDSDEFDVDLCLANTNSATFGAAVVTCPCGGSGGWCSSSGWGTKMTETQLSSESSDVSLWNAVQVSS